MNDFQIEDPRKASAKKARHEFRNRSNRRTVLQYLFDIFVKSLILFSILALDFVLFANSGNYNLFLSSVEPMPEVVYIFIGIGILSFVLIFISSFIKPLENIVLSVAMALFCLAVINQFATFEKKSVFVVLFDKFLDENLSLFFYEHCYLIVASIVFFITWVFLACFDRHVLFYFMLLLLSFLGWMLSEAYLNTSVQYYRVAASAPAFRSDSIGKNLVFLIFRNLTSPNNLQKMAKESKDSLSIENSVKNTLGFFSNHNFVLYPNALQKSSHDPFLNLVSSYNPDAKENIASYVQNTAVRDSYFDFHALQSEKKFMKKNSLYEMLRKEGYSITVFQSTDMDMCYVDNKLAVSVCKEKIGIPMTMSSEYFSIMEKTWLLLSQWLNSTGFVSSLDSVLQALNYVYPLPDLKPLGFVPDKVAVVNSYKALDQIAEEIDKQNGNQAYFAIIDLPSETYVYDEFCQMKPMSNWVSEKGGSGAAPLKVRRTAYAEQVSCMYGLLEKFMQQLSNSGMLENTSIIIEGLNNPLKLNTPDNDYYTQLQNKEQVLLAVKKAQTSNSNIDYSVCSVPEILNSFFFTHRPCQEFEGMTMAEKLAGEVKQKVSEQEFSSSFLGEAARHFLEWFNIWSIKNQFGNEAQPSRQLRQNLSDVDLQTENHGKDVMGQGGMEETAPEMEVEENQDTSMDFQAEEDRVEEISSKENVFQNNESDVSETEEHGLSDSQDQTMGKEVIPDTLYDAVKVIQQTEAEEAIEKAKRSLTQKEQEGIKQDDVMRPQFPDIKVNLEKADLSKKSGLEVKTVSKKNVVQLKTDSAEVHRNVLEAPVANGQGLSPEELKKQYHKILENSGALHVKTIEN